MKFLRIIRFCGLMLFAYCLFSPSLSAQSESSGRLEVDLDALAFARSGYGVRLGYQHRHLRMGVATFNHRQPSLVIGERNVSIRTSGIGFGVDYFLRPARGIFVGLHTAFHEEELRRVTTEATASQKSVEAGLQAGYRWSLGREEENLRGLYVEAILSVSSRLGGQPVSLGAGTYTVKAVAVQPGLRLGYRF